MNLKWKSLESYWIQCLFRGICLWCCLELVFISVSWTAKHWNSLAYFLLKISPLIFASLMAIVIYIRMKISICNSYEVSLTRTWTLLFSLEEIRMKIWTEFCESRHCLKWKSSSISLTLIVLSSKSLDVVLRSVWDMVYPQYRPTTFTVPGMYGSL